MKYLDIGLLREATTGDILVSKFQSNAITPALYICNRSPESVKPILRDTHSMLIHRFGIAKCRIFPQTKAASWPISHITDFDAETLRPI